MYRNDDRRQRFEDRRMAGEDRRFEPEHHQQRARHEAHLWFTPSFGAHILGQVSPAKVTPTEAKRAYGQPESRTPLRPNVVQSV
ncbi:MAG: hypothetical protein Q8R82_15360 [Hyphomonadaceae bacterium]|nr:hypothetical protein [Hyphomonadaceae bacterium]